MCRRIIKGIIAVIRQEIAWFNFRIWMKSRATRYVV